MIEVDEHVHRPKLSAQFIASDDFSGSFEQSSQHLKGLFLKSYFVSALTQLSGLKVNLERTEAENDG
jgi:hypothetical protein